MNNNLFLENKNLFLKIEKLRDWQSIKNTIDNNHQLIENTPWNSNFIQLYKQQNYLKNLLNDYNNCQEEFQLISIINKDIDNLQLENLNNNLNKNLNNLYQLLKYNDDDLRDVILEIHSGSGGQDSEDWAMMLYKMYIGWINKNNYNYEILDWQTSQVGLKYTTIKITNGNFLYGQLKNETGIHRLVRLSPFNANNKRHTSFASVNVMPLVEDDTTIIINNSDLKIDTYKSSGAGGQHVNTTDSAVRITYLPKNIVVECQKERSQHSNKQTALNMLKSKLLQLKIQEQQKLKKEHNQQKHSIDFGYQKRSYILHPYQLVKDNDTGIETSKTIEVLKGNIDIFLQ
jgi:peptide chain release factor 2